MRRNIILSDRAYRILSNAVKQAENRHETGGVLLGHRRRGSYWIVDATVPAGDETMSYCSFEIDGERETEKADRIMGSYRIKPEPVGLWHSHLTGIKVFSYQDRLSNQVFAKAYHDIVSLIVIPDSQGETDTVIPYAISPDGHESSINFGNRKIPEKYLFTMYSATGGGNTGNVPEPCQRVAK